MCDVHKWIGPASEYLNFIVGLMCGNPSIIQHYCLRKCFSSYINVAFEGNLVNFNKLPKLKGISKDPDVLVRLIPLQYGVILIVHSPENIFSLSTIDPAPILATGHSLFFSWGNKVNFFS
jgi:hypothetical protein